MIMRYLIVSLLLLGGLFAEQINHLMATVGSIGITEIDLQDEIQKIKKSGATRPKNKSITSLAIKSLIDRAIIKNAAKEESIIVTDEKIDSVIKREIEGRGLKNQENLQNELAKYSISWEDYRKSIQERIMGQQVASQMIKLAPPSDIEIKQFYNKNISKLGFRYFYRLISIPFKVGNTRDELRVNKLIAQAKRVAQKNFGRAAKRYSHHPSKEKGGIIGWQMLNEAAQINPQLPALIQQSPLNQVSQEFPLGDSYFIVKVEKRVKPSLDDLKNMITNRIYSEKQQEQFSNWLVEERRRLAVKVHLKNYRKP